MTKIQFLSEMRKVFLFSILIMVISSNLADSKDFNFNYPDEVNVNEEFQVKIISDLTEDYDVKIFILDNESSEVLSEIMDNEWRSPFKYILSAYPSKEIFKIRAIKPVEFGSLCVQIRLSGGTKYEKSCKGITIINYTPSGRELTNELPLEKTSQLTQLNQQNDKIIVLNYPDEKEKIELTRDYQKERIIFFSFIIFLVFFIILLSFRLL